METRLIEISLDTAKRWYEQGGEYRDIALTAFKEHELIGDRLPKTWEEYRKMKGDEGEKANAALNFAYTSINSAFPDYHDTQKHIVLMKLHLLRDEYRNGWLPDWNKNLFKCCIVKHNNDYVLDLCDNLSHFLAFQSEEIAEEFLNNFRKLIEQAGDLI